MQWSRSFTGCPSCACTGVRALCLFLLVLVLSLAAAPRAAALNAASEQMRHHAQLVNVVNRNVGHAHFTRGMNVCTVLALRDATTEADIPVLLAMLGDRDHIVRMTAARVLADFGEPGRTALKEAKEHAARADADDIREAIQETAINAGSMKHYRENGLCQRHK